MTTTNHYYAVYMPLSNEYRIDCLSTDKQETYDQALDYLKEYVSDDYEYKDVNINELRLEDSHWQVVEISKQLYDYIESLTDYEANDLTSNWISINDYKSLPKELTYIDILPTTNEPPLHDIKPYSLITKQNKQLLVLDADNPKLDPTGAYYGNSNLINWFTDIQKGPTDENNQPLETICQGLADNVTQIKRYLDYCLYVYYFKNDVAFESFHLGRTIARYLEQHPTVKFTLFLKIITKNEGYAWTTNDEYIGVFQPQQASLTDEAGIDYLLHWELIPILDAQIV